MARRAGPVVATATAAGRLFPVSLVLLPVALGLEVATGQSHALHAWLREHFAVSWPAMAHFELYRLALSPLIQTRPGIVGTVVWLVCVFIPWLEWRLGSRVAAAVFFLGDWLSTVAVLAVLRVAGAFDLGDAARLAATPDSGSSAGAFAAAAAIAATYSRRTRAILLGALFAFLVYRLLRYGHLYDFEHTLASVAGAVLSLWVLSRRVQLKGT